MDRSRTEAQSPGDAGRAVEPPGWVDRREICIDQSLDPEERPKIEGRYRFTLAHEGGGHWRLHRAYLSREPNQASLFGEPNQPTVVCRSSQSKERVEWQADFYASCLLMPRSMVLGAWQARFGHLRPISLSALKKKETQIFTAEMLVRGGMIMDRKLMDDAMLDWVARPFANEFGVSPIAMRIRMEKLGLLLREAHRQKQFVEFS